MGALILLLIIILPCIVKILWKSIWNFATELHLTVLKKIKEGKMPGASMGDPTHDKVMWRGLMDKASQDSVVSPWIFLNI